MEIKDYRKEIHTYPVDPPKEAKPLHPPVRGQGRPEHWLGSKTRRRDRSGRREQGGGHLLLCCCCFSCKLAAQSAICFVTSRNRSPGCSPCPHLSFLGASPTLWLSIHPFGLWAAERTPGVKLYSKSTGRNLVMVEGICAFLRLENIVCFVSFAWCSSLRARNGPGINVFLATIELIISL